MDRNRLYEIILDKWIPALITAVIGGLVIAEYTGEKNGTVSAYDASSRMVTIRGKDWEQRATVTNKVAETQKNLLKEGAKVKVEFDDRGAGDVRVKSISPR